MILYFAFFFTSPLLRFHASRRSALAKWFDVTWQGWIAESSKRLRNSRICSPDVVMLKILFLLTCISEIICGSLSYHIQLLCRSRDKHDEKIDMSFLISCWCLQASILHIHMDSLTSIRWSFQPGCRPVGGTHHIPIRATTQLQNLSFAAGCEPSTGCMTIRCL